MKKALLIYLTTFFLAATAFAVPAKRGIMTRTQSDGTVVSYELFGDEFNHHTVVDGIYTVMSDSDGDFCYATIKDNILVSTGVKVRPMNKLSAKEKEIALQSVGLRSNYENPLFNRSMHSPRNALARRAEAMGASYTAPNQSALSIDRWGGEVLGNRNLLVILVSYPDKPFTVEQPREKFISMLNDEGYSANGCNGGVKDYFTDASNGKFVPTFDVVGPYCLPHNRAYYGGTDKNGNHDAKAAYMAVDACNLAAADGVDFSKYDNDNDNEIDLVFIVYAGHNEAEGGPAESIWPHHWGIYPGANIEQQTQPEYNGKKFTNYSCSSELKGAQGSQICNIGTFCHEFGHAIGLPDWYDTNGTGCLGLSYTSIMNSGNYLNDSRTPPTYNIIERWMLGWAFPKEISDTGMYEISHISNDDAYIIWANSNKTECFLFESRVAAANYKWDKYLNEGDKDSRFQGGEGMLVYHLDWDFDVYNKWKYHEINTDNSHECAKLFRANPNAGEETSKGWFYPGSRNVRMLSYDTTPKLQNWNGDKLPFYIDNITITGDKVTFWAMVKELHVDTRQYDSLIDWQAAELEVEYNEWRATCVNEATGETIYDNTFSTKFVNIYPLAPDNKYLVNIYGEGSQEPLYEMEIKTQSNVLMPMSSLNIGSTHDQNKYIRLGVKNLDCEIEDIVWRIDGNVTEDTYIKLSAGEHLITAAITDTTGNTQYLYRYITVQ